MTAYQVASLFKSSTNVLADVVKRKRQQRFRVDVQFVGCSGSGKTTCSNAALRATRFRWRSMRMPAGGGGAFYGLGRDVENFYALLLKVKSKQILGSTSPAFVKAKELSFAAKKVAIDMSARLSEGNNSFWEDDGVFHEFSSPILELISQSEALAGTNDFISSRLVIHIRNSPGTIVRNIRDRAKSSGLYKANSFNWLNDEELFELAANRIGICERLVDELQKKKVPCLSVDTDVDLERTIAEIVDFVDTHVEPR